MTVNARHLALASALALTGVACDSEPLEFPPDTAAPAPGLEPPETGADRAALDYPPGPFGTGEGAIVPNLEFRGWRAPAEAEYDPTRFETIRLSDFYNPDGSRGNAKLLLINASAVWCSVCRAEMKDFRDADIYNQYKERGLEILGVLFEDNNYNPATPADLATWGSPRNFDIKFPLVLDPGFKIGAFFASDATPLNLLVDLRTMEILDTTMGYDSTASSNYWSVIDALLD